MFAIDYFMIEKKNLALISSSASKLTGYVFIQDDIVYYSCFRSTVPPP
jgi:hypothetical protein